MKHMRKNTQVPQPSGFTKHVVDEVVYKELNDRLVRAATTASSLEAEHDSGNIDKTQSKATPNEAISPGTTLGGGPRGNTLQSDEDRMKLNELMELCTNLQSGALDLEKTKTTQALEIDSLKWRGRIEAIDADEDITIVNNQDDAEMFDVNDLHGEEMFVDKEVTDKEVNDEENDEVQEVVEDINTAKLIVDAAQVNDAGEANAASIATTDSATAIITTKEITLAHVLEEIKTTKPKAKELVLQEPKEQQKLTDEEKATLFMQLLEKRRKFFAAKRAEEKRNKPPTQAQQRKIMCTYLKNMEGNKLKDLKNKSFYSI
nr:hypothetical protein [Tanacetum cinerariifolium]